MKRITLKQLSFAALLTGAIVLSGCHKKIPPPAAAVAPPPPLVTPTATITANPSVIQQGQSTTLTWRTTNATDASIGNVGAVALSGSQTVSPSRSGTFTVTAKGPGGTVEASTEVTVNRPPQSAEAPSPLTEEQLFTQNVRDIYFDYNEDDLRPGDTSIAAQDAAFLSKHPGMKIVIGGYCDDRGSAEYNIALGENRAESLKKALVADGVPATRLRVISYGKEKPFCTEENESCWQQNRRDHLTMDR